MTPAFRNMLFACAAITAGAAQTATAQEFYTGKTVNIIVGSDVAGGYDTYARLFSRHLGEQLPGKPNMVVQNMPGAGSARAAGFLYTSAAKDGMTIALLQPGAIVGPLVDKTMKANYDATKFTYLASADSGTRVCISLPNSHIKTFKQAQTERVIVGAAGNGASSRDYGFLHKNTSGAKFEIVSGYKGMADILLAMERKEIDVVCGLDWSSAKAQRPALVRDKSLNVLVQMGVDKNAELDAWGVPEIMSFTQGADNRAIVELIVAQQAFGRPFLMAPGNPEIAVKQMRAAFMAAMKSPALLADAEKIGLDITPATGERVQDVVQKMYQTPDRIVDLASKAIRE
jgi:tripartite-type tricarboxylate transporter receptor subunit TctC